MRIPFFSAKIEHLDRYLSKQAYDKAVSAIESELRRDPGDFRLRRRLADVYLLADDPVRSIEILRDLAEEYSSEGFHARAVVLFKEILEIDPSRQDVHRELAALIGETGRSRVLSAPTPAPSSPETASQTATSSPPAVAMPSGDEADAATAGSSPREPLSREVVDDGSPRDGSSEARSADPQSQGTQSSGTQPPNVQSPDSQSLTKEPPAAQLSPAKPPVTAPPTPPASPDEEQRAKELAASALFTLFEGPALEEVLTLTNLRSYKQGDIIVTEGEEGSSLFVIVEGEVKVFTRDPRGRHVPLATMGAGDLFGEVSVLHGKPRTATITAAAPTLAIELVKDDIERASEDYPRVREVLLGFCEERARNAIERLIRAGTEDEAVLEGGGPE